MLGKFAVVAVTVCGLLVLGVGYVHAQAGKSPAGGGGPKYAKPVVTIETTLGMIVMELFPKDAPKSVDNFVKLASKGYYDGITFHRIVKGFVIQGGDPNTKDNDPNNDGSGGPGYKFDDEPVKGEYTRGAVAMANSGPNTNGSQFFICLEDLSQRLPKKYNLFGKVTQGMDVVDKIAKVEVDSRDRPIKNVAMKKVTVKEGAK
jgi:cyclophilin family peptidyl-prolyl cis-trans isomerase